MAARYVRIACSALALLVVASLGCRSRSSADAEGGELARRRAGLLAGSHALVLDPQAVGAPVCPAPRLQIGAAGVTVSIYPSNGALAEGAPPSSSATAPSLWKQVVVPRDGICPSVPRREGHLDDEALVSLLRATIAVRPRCPPERVPEPGEDDWLRRLNDAVASPLDKHVLIEPTDDIPWSEIAEVVAAAAEAGLTDVRFLATSRAPADCQGAVTPATLRARLASRGAFGAGATKDHTIPAELVAAVIGSWHLGDSCRLTISRSDAAGLHVHQEATVRIKGRVVRDGEVEYDGKERTLSFVGVGAIHRTVVTLRPSGVGLEYAFSTEVSFGKWSHGVWEQARRD